MLNFSLTLYSGQQCHLCDLAMALIESHAPSLVPTLEKVDVASDHQLYHLYGARIPVIKRSDSGAELGWPFDAEQLALFLA